jgi:hypothetical protein
MRKNQKYHSNNPYNNMNQRHFNDPFGMDDDRDDFGFGIHDDFDDPFEGLMGGFGFPNIGQIHQRLFGNMDREFGNMGQLGNGEERHHDGNRTGLQRGGGNHFQSFFSMQGTGPGTGTVITKSYSSKIDYRDGRPHQECYQSQSINQIGKDGHKISEKQEAYKNSRTGVQKAAHQRLLDDKGMKQIRQRNINTGAQEEHNIFKGMREEELNDFNKNYNDYRNKIGFQKNYKYLNAMNPYKRGKSQNYIGTGNRGHRPQQELLMLGNGNEQPQQYQQPRPKIKKGTFGKKFNKK